MRYNVILTVKNAKISLESNFPALHKMNCLFANKLLDFGIVNKILIVGR